MTAQVNRAENFTNEQETALLVRVAAADREAFDALYGTYQPRIFKFVFRLTRSYGASDELTNDVLLTVWQDAARFRGDSRVSTWIFGIAYRKSLGFLRKRKLKLVPVLDRDLVDDESTRNLERQDWVQQGIERLPPKQRLTVMLVYFLGLSCEETAAVTRSPVSTVKTRMFHARRKLKDHLAESATPFSAVEDEDND